MRIAVLSYLATYANAPGIALALSRVGHDVTLVIAEADAYRFCDAFRPTIFAGRDGASNAADACTSADRFVLCGTPALTHLLPRLPDRAADLLKENGGILLVGDSHILQRPREVNETIGEFPGIHVLAMPDKVPYLERCDGIFWPPVDVPEAGERPSDSILVCHSPGKASRLDWKGSACIRQAIETVAADNPGLVYRELRGLPHAECCLERARCDVFVDQIIGGVAVPGAPDWHGGIGKSGLEALAAGCRVVATGDNLPAVCDRVESPDAFPAVLTSLIGQVSENPGARFWDGIIWAERNASPTAVVQLLESYLG